MTDSAGRSAAFAFQHREINRLTSGSLFAYYCAFEQGLGKSLISLVAAQELGARRILVIAPAVAGVSWRQQGQLWAPGMRCIVVERPTDISANDGVTVISWAKINRPEFFRLLVALEWDVIIVDEAQYAKDRSAKRTKALLGSRLDGRNGIVSHARTAVFVLSGTPAPNHAGELYPIIRALWPEVITDPVTSKVWNEHRFLERYCVLEESRFGTRVVGSKNQIELKRKIAVFLSRETKRSAGLDMPEQFDVELPLEADPTYAASVAAFDAEVRALIQANPDTDIASLLNREGMHLATRRRELGLAKAKPGADWADLFLQGCERKLLIFAAHLQVLDIVQHELSRSYGVVRIDGSTSLAARDAAINAFQTNPRVRVFLGQIKAASTAITLHAGSDVLLLEAEWTPGVNAQAVARAHRLGQRNTVTAYYAAVDGSLDENVMRTFRRKAAELAQLI